MTYPETLDYLYSRLPMFTKIGSSAIKKDLTNTRKLCAVLGNPQDNFRSVHVAGTNGKGSTSHLLSAILQTAGYKTGLYTSPHLRDFRERIRINGEMISEAEVVDFVERIQPDIEITEPSFFEVTVAMAFDHFSRHQVDVAVIEVGLGGRLDSTNIIMPELSVITNIGLDHVNILGNTLPEIAAEKAGIIKPGIPVVIGEKHEETAPVFLHQATDCDAPLVFASDEWQVVSSSVEDGKLNVSVTDNLQDNLTVALDLTGTYQLKNLVTVLSSVKQLNSQGFAITHEHIREALQQVQRLTGLMGRWQVLSKAPLIICDTGHNEDGIREVVKNIRATAYRHLHIVIGMVKDKDIAKVLSLLPVEATYYFCNPGMERAKPAIELRDEALRFGLKGETYPSVKAALSAAKTHAAPDDLVFVGGSTFVVAEVV
ncbi:bifunctional folylpolyglutamate synthase/dihydrofolate synthase [Pedobacter sp. BS3]|uniref:bifunctional folylpolyglutamate synthase/dihydrofolate synthase n=1 Tax=Pedobacter sp. BS3 TaxID=2567937 RepID=UPI0011F021C0|nr:folylpolyglutamate synthase/dihydrofolate synthase family protein [Pedobacter sp. BS3]TZF84694.1 bifunctional folylpolyglutamate synthase/dihydrofolate synthase [Pedobacter sp. BS3]